MQKQKIEEIELKTRDILSDVLGDLTEIQPPINLAKILDKYKFKLAMAKFPDDTIAGAYDSEKHTILLASSDSTKRQAFTVAHELGHYFLHKKKRDVFYRHQAYDFDGEDSQDEKEANWFAASLLMPKELVLKAWNKAKDIELLAAYFGVSRSAAFWRLKNLNII